MTLRRLTTYLSRRRTDAICRRYLADVEQYRRDRQQGTADLLDLLPRRTQESR